MNLFDENYYIEQKLQQLANMEDKDTNAVVCSKEAVYDLLAAAGLTAREHYDLYGWKEGLNPSAIFDNYTYLYEKLELDRTLSPEISYTDFLNNFASSGLSPLQHFELFGNKEWLSPTTLFDVDEYITAKAEHEYGSASAETIQAVCDNLAAANLSPWEDFLQNGASQDIDPSDAFDMSAYVEDKYEHDVLVDPTLTSAASTLAYIEASGLNPLTHYLLHGQYEGLRPTGDYSANVIDLGNGAQAHVLGLDYLTLEDLSATQTIDSWYGVRGILSEAIVDTEKVYPIEHQSIDNLMCWAATAANLLTLSGWATAAGFTPTATEDLEDVVFQKFVDSFGNDCGFTQDALSWFFNGTLVSEQNYTLLDPGNYLGIEADPYSTILFRNTVQGNFSFKDFQILAANLDQGNAIGVSFSWLLPDVTLGHAITVLGYTIDTNYAADDPRYYTGLIVSDSDNSRMYLDRGESVDSAQYLQLSWNGETYINGFGGEPNLYGEDTLITLNRVYMLELNSEWTLA